MNENLIIRGKNAVLESIKSQRARINAVYAVKGAKGIGEQISAAKAAGITVKEITADKMAELCGDFGGRGERGSQQGRSCVIAAALSPVGYLEMDELLAGLPPEPFLLIADGIEDPHNLGALIRTAEAAGVCAVIIPKRRSVQVTAAAYSASAGAAAHMPVARATNLVAAINALKERGVWVYGAEADGEPYTGVNFGGSGGVCLVIGSEGGGLGRLVRENCDFVVSVPMRGKINSLNASVCGGILMFAIAESKYKGKGGGQD